jgi:hypothetical protein
MWKRRRTWLLLLAVVGLTIAGLYEYVTHVGRGWLCGEAFFDGRPTSYWAAEIQQWEFHCSAGESNGHSEYFVRRSPWPGWQERYLPKGEWPQLLNGDADAFPVLQQLRHFPSTHVQYLAGIGIERIENG